MYNRFFTRKIRSLAFLFRRRLNKQYIIIESDDWGLERAWSPEGIRWAEAVFGRERFTRWTTDSLETKDDLAVLYEVLFSFRNKFSSAPVITANFITHNVGRDHEGKIWFRPISDGFFSDIGDVRPMYFEGIRSGLICPQYHGYCHFIPAELKKFNCSAGGDDAYNNRFFTVQNTLRGSLSLFHGELTLQNVEACANTSEGLSEFENFFGFKSYSIIPPTYRVDKFLLDRLPLFGIRYIQAGTKLMQSNDKFYFFPPLREIKKMYWGIRNARLDPHPDYGFNHEQCLALIQRAFQNSLPAVIDFHRVNFAGRYAPAYRDRTLIELRALLEGIHRTWPAVQFISTPQLISLLHGTPQSN